MPRFVEMPKRSLLFLLLTLLVFMFDVVCWTRTRISGTHGLLVQTPRGSVVPMWWEPPTRWSSVGLVTEYGSQKVHQNPMDQHPPVSPMNEQNCTGLDGFGG